MQYYIEFYSCALNLMVKFQTKLFSENQGSLYCCNLRYYIKSTSTITKCNFKTVINLFSLKQCTAPNTP